MSITDPNWVAEFGRTVEKDPEFALGSRQAVFSFLLEADDRRYVLAVDRGRVSVTADATMAQTWDFVVRASTETWRRYIDRDPDPEYRDALGMAFQGAMSQTGNVKSHLVVEGNQQKLFANLQPLYVLLQKLRKN